MLGMLEMLWMLEMLEMLELLEMLESSQRYYYKKKWILLHNTIADTADADGDN